MNKTIFILAAAVFSGAMLLVACSDTPGRSKNMTVLPDSTALVARGAYLVNAIGCDDCHSPKKMGPQGPEIIADLRFSGFQQNAQLPKANPGEVKKGFLLFSPDLTAAIGPWGISYAANISADATGIGNWTEANFIRSIRQGKLKGMENGRTLLPPMPWPTYKNLNDEDLRSIFAYLKTTKPVANIVPGPKPLSEL